MDYWKFNAATVFLPNTQCGRFFWIARRWLEFSNLDRNCGYLQDEISHADRETTAVTLGYGVTDFLAWHADFGMATEPFNRRWTTFPHHSIGNSPWLTKRESPSFQNLWANILSSFTAQCPYCSQKASQWACNAASCLNGRSTTWDFWYRSVNESPLLTLWTQ